MNSTCVMQPENLGHTVHALTLFHAGKWAQALLALRQAYDLKTSSAEVSATLGICEGFSAGPLEPGLGVMWEPLERVISLLHQGTPAGWAEVSACQAWLQLLQEGESFPEKTPAALDRLVDACHQSRWFPVWALAFRALAYYDRRQAIRDLLAQAVESPASGSHGLELVLAEARLECACPVPVTDLVPQDIDVHDCLPLAPEVARLWQQWLLAEFAWWESGEPETVERTIADLLETPAPDDDPYSLNEWDRLTRHAALLGARCALSRCAVEKALQWIEWASRNRPCSWECQYLSGLVAWSQGERQSAKALLKRSLADNPFQSRVRFELGMLLSGEDPSGSRSYLETMPAVHDAAASSAVVLFRLDQESETRRHLEQLDQAEAPYSLRLIWPRTRRLRLRQGKNLRAHLAETNQDWPEALKRWDEARQSHEAPGQETRSQARDLVHRAHRLYLLGRCLRQKNAAGEEDHDKMTHTQFHKELGKLSIRPLMGEAMFYRGLAAEKSMPDRAIADWRALLRQSTWVEQTQKVAPTRLLCLGDRLLKVGLDMDAHKAYDLASATSVAGAQERVFTSRLITQHPFEAAHLVQILESADSFAPDDARWSFLRALCLLAKDPPDREAAQPFLERTRQTGLPAQWEQLGKLLLVLVEAEPDAGRQLCSFLDGEESMGTFPSMLRPGLEALCRPEGLETLRRFQEVLGPDWAAWCPIPPEEVIGLQLRVYCVQSDYAAALDQVQGAKRMGISIPGEWSAFLYASQAVQVALSGNFEAAEVAQQQALESLSPDQQEVEEHENSV
jgi:hypothetical protein